MTLSTAQCERGGVALPTRDEGLRSLRGYSLVELLIVNALALTLVAAVFAATADLIATAAVSSAQSDQAMRARQVVRFIEQALVSARMPAEWLGSDAGTWSHAGWQTPSPICTPPDEVSPGRRWGGVDVIKATDLPCIATGDATWGLYVEQIRVCPEDCGAGAGYVISPSPCSGAVPGISEQTQWRVAWQSHMDRPPQCNSGWPWGRVERVLLTDRTGRSSIEGLPTLRFQSVSGEMAYKWLQAETLVAGITDWHPAMIAIPPPARLAAAADASTLKLLAVAMAVTPSRGAHGVPLLSVTRSLLPSTNTQRLMALGGG
jgi:hypothetical protein